MDMATMSCEKATTEETRVVMEYPKTPRELCRHYCNRFGRAFVRSPCGPTLVFLFCVIIGLTGLAIVFSFVWIPLLVVGHCHLTPGLELKEVNVHAMNATLADTAYQVDSEVTLQLNAWNKNTVMGCSTTFRRVSVFVYFNGQRLLYQVVPFEGWGLKPGESRSMTLNLKGEKAPSGNEIGSLLVAELQNATPVMLTVSIAARWMRNDRKAAWMGMNCDVNYVKTPPTSSGGLVYGFCYRF